MEKFKKECKTENCPCWINFKKSANFQDWNENKNGFKNTGPRYMQMLSYKCRDETVIKSQLLFEPYGSAVVEQELCDVISYLESEYGVIKERTLD